MLEWSVEFIVVFIAAYLSGSVSAAIIVCKLMRLPDPRSQGSHNPGATNVLRIGGKKAAAITLLGDGIKGVIPVLIAKFLGFSPAQLSLVAMAAFLGHLYPVFFQFKGGKGVATAFGVFVALSWPVGLTALATWLVVAFVFKVSSLAALITALFCPLYFWLLETSGVYTVMALVISVILTWRHRSNIVNLIQGSEEKINE
ncbi:MAG: glycerol-3-phosphate 1-O-acyltransferase PlsY [Gammaproteobacteria bacterium]|nr:glycerol-3-phosphate 1-O-acyltransferase PlsY [Gammaproteobacteria bacterium]MDH5801150.1 glycerol-3-phosphate 1-O-acyltransferase PlsY [Gammaproteobacteria bacterium]